MPPKPPNKNRLSAETSPYLLQHADNPVAWHPWDDAALKRARREDKPILLSIGYAACHWCHVMAHESFEDKKTAELMNRLFVNIKVDREERPDLDKIYQSSHSLLTQRSGGWPLTMFLDPRDCTPFFGGTYFPDQPRHGMPSFREILVMVGDFYRDHRHEIDAQGTHVRNALKRIYAPTSPAPAPPTHTLRHSARDALITAFDPVHGGFGDAPKFPQTALLEFLLHLHADENDPRGAHVCLHTLDQLCDGGIRDHPGGGFYRYAVDRSWTIPHFEKMLYDNGPLISLLCDAHILFGGGRYARAATEAARWVMREMQAEDGGYYSSLDADSEGEEGRFYIWDRDEVRQLLGDARFAPFAQRFGLDGPPNFEGRWHLRVAGNGKPMPSPGAFDDDLRALLEHRAARPRPGLDTKRLTSWNALMIKGMAKAARHLGEADCLASAERALACLRAAMPENGALHAVVGDARLPGYLDDYAFLIDALLHLLECRWDDRDLDLACALADTLLARFEDAKTGGYYFTDARSKVPLQRPRNLYDEALPSGYGVACLTLGRLGCITGETKYLRSVERALNQAAGRVAHNPEHCPTLLRAMHERDAPPEIIVVRATKAALPAWRRAANAHFAVSRLCFVAPPQAAAPALGDKPHKKQTTAYVCKGVVCEEPITDLQAFSKRLATNAAIRAPHGAPQPA